MLSAKSLVSMIDRALRGTRYDLRIHNQQSVLSLIVALVLLVGSIFSVASAQQSKKPFSVSDEIGLALYGYGEQQEPVRFSRMESILLSVQNEGEWT